jgi:pimeloyl-ACP methyl ester carboxylesterase
MGLDTNTVDQNNLIYYGSQSMDSLAALEYLGALQQMSTRYTVKNIKKPVFVISSALDKFKGAVFGNDETDFLLGNIQDAKSFVFEDSGHFPYITSYRMFNETVQKYLMEYGY